MTTEISQRNYLKETIGLKNQIEGAFLEMAERLYKIREEKLWEGEYEDFDTFILEMKLSKPTVSKLCSVYETFVLTHKIPTKKLAPIGWSSLYAIAPYATTLEKAEELVDRAGLLTRDHLVTSLKDEAKDAGCAHTNTRTVVVCNDCSHRQRIYEN